MGKSLHSMLCKTSNSLGFHNIPYPYSVKVIFYWILKIDVFSHNVTISFNTEEQRIFWNLFYGKRVGLLWIGSRGNQKFPLVYYPIHNKPFRMVKIWTCRGCIECQQLSRSLESEYMTGGGIQPPPKNKSPISKAVVLNCSQWVPLHHFIGLGKLGELVVNPSLPKRLNP